MGWSFRIGRLAGINIYVHFTFLILLGFIGLSGYLQTGDPAVAAVGLGLIIAVFGIIVLHELGHALAARHYGIPTKDITLLPIGGVARLQRMPDKPAQELVVALAGPAVNVVLAVALRGASWSSRGRPPSTPRRHQFHRQRGRAAVPDQRQAGDLQHAAGVPDGRRPGAARPARHAAGAGRATDIAAKVGKGMAVLFAIVGLFGLPPCRGRQAQWVQPNLMLVLVALFVWTGAEAEARAMRAKAGLAGVPVAAVMVRRFAAVDPDDTLGAIADYARQTFQRDFPVVVSGRVVGLVGREDIRAGLAEFGPDGRVFQVMHRDFPTVEPGGPGRAGLCHARRRGPDGAGGGLRAAGRAADAGAPAEYVRVGGLRRDESASAPRGPARGREHLQSLGGSARDRSKSLRSRPRPVALRKRSVAERHRRCLSRGATGRSPSAPLPPGATQHASRTGGGRRPRRAVRAGRPGFGPGHLLLTPYYYNSPFNPLVRTYSIPVMYSTYTSPIVVPTRFVYPPFGTRRTTTRRSAGEHGGRGGPKPRQTRPTKTGDEVREDDRAATKPSGGPPRYTQPYPAFRQVGYSTYTTGPAAGRRGVLLGRRLQRPVGALLHAVRLRPLRRPVCAGLLLGTANDIDHQPMNYGAFASPYFQVQFGQGYGGWGMGRGWGGWGRGPGWGW